MDTTNPQHELRRLFSGLVEHVFFSDLGLCVPRLTDYLTDMLSEFVRADHVYPLQVLDPAAVQAAAQVQAESELAADAGQTTRVRVVNRYIGDLALFWTGVYPEMLTPRRQCGIDRLREYTLQGKRGYGIASELSRAGDAPPADLLRDLSEQFEFCMRGLYLVRQSWSQRTRQPRRN